MQNACILDRKIFGPLIIQTGNFHYDITLPVNIELVRFVDRDEIGAAPRVVFKNHLLTLHYNPDRLGKVGWNDLVGAESIAKAVEQYFQAMGHAGRVSWAGTVPQVPGRLEMCLSPKLLASVFLTSGVVESSA